MTDIGNAFAGIPRAVRSPAVCSCVHPRCILTTTRASVADGELFTGTVSDFSSLDPIIYREPLQTEQYDSISLNGKSDGAFA